MNKAESSLCVCRCWPCVGSASRWERDFLGLWRAGSARTTRNSTQKSREVNVGAWRSTSVQHQRCVSSQKLRSLKKGNSSKIEKLYLDLVWVAKWATHTPTLCNLDTSDREPKTGIQWASIDASLIWISNSGLNRFHNACRIQEAIQGSKSKCRILWQLYYQYRWSDSSIWSQCFWPAWTQHQGRWLNMEIDKFHEITCLTSPLHTGWHTRHDQVFSVCVNSSLKFKTHFVC